MKPLKSYLIILVGLATILSSCTETYDIKSKSTESLLVIEATITDELKQQEIKVSKTFPLDSNEPSEVSGAQVWIELDNGIQYSFVQSEPGLYLSTEVFRAEAGINYTLKVNLSDGGSYVSTPEVLPPAAGIESLQANLQVIDGVQGIQIYASSSSNGSDARYFKYDFEETYKIVVPYYNALDAEIIDDPDDESSYAIQFVPKPENVSTCYSSKKSVDIIQTSLVDSQTSSVVDFPVRFIASDDAIIRDRYSILVKQNVQSLDAYNFYKILKELGTIDNVFSNNQPGFIQGNLVSIDNPEENVIGFFQVTSVSTKRIFFNYEDFNLQQPAYPYDCNIEPAVDYNDRSDMDGDRNDYAFLLTVLTNGSYKYFAGQEPIYNIVRKACGDCTSFSSTVIPEFWED